MPDLTFNQILNSWFSINFFERKKSVSSLPCGWCRGGFSCSGGMMAFYLIKCIVQRKLIVENLHKF